MSNRTYNELWLRSMGDLHSVLAEEQALSAGKPERDKELAFRTVSRVYLRYTRVLRNLDVCYDQIVQPQKRILLRQILDAVIGRILELKQELVNLDCLEFSYHDEAMAELGLTPEDTELSVPRYVLRDKAKEIAYWDDQMTEALAKMEQSELESQGSFMSVEDAVVVLQVHERARQGRLRAKLMREIRRQEAADKSKLRVVDNVSQALAASRIQSVWKGVLTRRRVRKQREDELTFIGMIPPVEFAQEYQDRLREIEDSRKEIQDQHEQDFVKALVEVKEELHETEGQEIEEEMKEEIRNWFFSQRDDQGKFPDYPSDDEGGSGVIFNPEKYASGLGADLAAEKSTEPSKAKTLKAKRPGQSVDKKGKGKDGLGVAEEEEDESGFVLRQTEFVRQLRAAHSAFQEVWIRGKGLHVEGVPERPAKNATELVSRCYATFATWQTRDEGTNKRQTHDVAMIRDEKRVEVEDEIRKKVDNIMRDELDLLRIAAERDKGKKGKISKKRKKGKKKASKKGKKKKDKDLTPDRTTESLFEELVLNGIIQQHPKVPLKDFIGDINYTGSILKKRPGKEPCPGGADVRRLIAEYCILPMSSPVLRERSQHIKSLLLVGPEGAGKTMLVHSICTELGATFFDLTATNIVGKYPGKSGLNMLLHLVIKVSKLLQPAIIYIDQADKTFLKKVSKTDKSDPKRLKKDLPRLVRSLTSEDRVMLLGASRCPWECEQKGLTQTYQRIIMLPRPDYSQRQCLWKELILSHGGKIMRWSHKFDLSVLAKLSDGYTAGHVVAAVTQALTERRVLQQGLKPLQVLEFLTALAKHEPIYREEEEAYDGWYVKTPMGKKRLKFLEGDEEEAKKEKKKAGKKRKA